MRRRNEEIRSKYMTAIGTIDSIVRSTASNDQSSAHVDPHERVLAMDEHAQFSPIPAEYKTKKKIATGQYAAVEPRLKLSSASTVRAQNRQTDSKIVDLSRPLPLSFSARRQQITKKHTSTVESSLRGLFSANSQVHEGVDQGPIPPLFTPSENNPRATVEKRKEAVKSSFIRPSQRSKAEILQPKPLQLQGLKVARDFVPACCVLSTLSDEQRERGAERQSQSHRAPFK